MRDVVYRQYAHSFETHWWADHRRRIVSRWLKSLGVEPDGSRAVLEIGSGAGTEHRYLKRFGPVTGIEISPAGLEFCRERGYSELIEGDLNLLQLPEERFDLAVDFHVMYHEWVKSPSELLVKLHHSLKPGGRLILTEPAFESLRRGHDDAVMAARRWNEREMRALVESAGFTIERCSAFLTLLLPAVLVSLLVDKLHPTQHDVAELQRPNPIADRILRMIMAVERWLLRLHPLPVGTCWAIVARRP